MPTCQICHNKWSWMQTIKKTSTLNPSMTCPHCDKTQYQTQKSKGKMGMFTYDCFIAITNSTVF